jgi:hypothetical protein
MKINSTASRFIAVRKAMPKPISGGEIVPPTRTARIPAAHVHWSRSKIRALHEAANVKTMPGPANITNSLAV